MKVKVAATQAIADHLIADFAEEADFATALADITVASVHFSASVFKPNHLSPGRAGGLKICEPLKAVKDRELPEGSLTRRTS
jgi:hypothetical protein